MKHYWRMNNAKKSQSIFMDYTRRKDVKIMVAIIACLCIIKLIYDFAFIEEEFADYQDHTKPKIIHDKEWTMADAPNILLSKIDFDYKNKIRRSHFCDVSEDATRLLLVMVTSVRDNFTTRTAIRETWGSLTKYQGWNVRLIFLLSAIPAKESFLGYTNKRISQEIILHDDILLSNIAESNSSEVYQILMGYKWALNYCRTTDFILHTNENIYVELFKVIERIAYFSALNMLLCHAVWAEPVNRDEENERYISEKDYIGDYFPSHCSPTANIVSYDLVQGIYLGSKTEQLIPLVDVFLTGVVPRRLGMHLTDLGFEYQFDQRRALAWGRNGQYGQEERLPWMFTIFGNVENLSMDYHDMWNKITKVYSKVLSFEVSQESKYQPSHHKTM